MVVNKRADLNVGGTLFLVLFVCLLHDHLLSLRKRECVCVCMFSVCVCVCVAQGAMCVNVRQCMCSQWYTESLLGNAKHHTCSWGVFNHVSITTRKRLPGAST